jgi:hypothetical protein
MHLFWLMLLYLFANWVRGKMNCYKVFLKTLFIAVALGASVVQAQTEQESFDDQVLYHAFWVDPVFKTGGWTIDQYLFAVELRLDHVSSPCGKTQIDYHDFVAFKQAVKVLPSQNWGLFLKSVEKSVEMFCRYFDMAKWDWSMYQNLRKIKKITITIPTPAASKSGYDDEMIEIKGVETKELVIRPFKKGDSGYTPIGPWNDESLEALLCRTIIQFCGIESKSCPVEV